MKTAKPQLKLAKNWKTAPYFARKKQTARYNWNRKTAQKIDKNRKTANLWSSDTPIAP